MKNYIVFTIHELEVTYCSSRSEYWSFLNEGGTAAHLAIEVSQHDLPGEAIEAANIHAKGFDYKISIHENMNDPANFEFEYNGINRL